MFSNFIFMVIIPMLIKSAPGVEGLGAVFAGIIQSTDMDLCMVKKVDSL